MRLFFCLFLVIGAALGVSREAATARAGSCSKMEFVPTALRFAEGSPASTNLDVDLLTGDAHLRMSRGGETQSCIYRMRERARRELKRVLKANVSFCGPSSLTAKVVRLTGPGGRSFSMGRPSGTTVNMNRGYDRFESNLRGFIREAEAKGSCNRTTGVADLRY